MEGWKCGALRVDDQRGEKEQMFEPKKRRGQTGESPSTDASGFPKESETGFLACAGAFTGWKACVTFYGRSAAKSSNTTVPGAGSGW